MGAVLSHGSAADLWGIRRDRRRTIHVTALGRHRPRPGIALHLVGELHAEDRTALHGIPVTSVARTLLDLALGVSEDALARALEESERLQLFDLGAVDALIARSRGRRGVAKLKRAVAAYREPPPLTRSRLEERFVAVCRKAGLPAPALNTWIAGHEVDALWAGQRLVVELDGWSYHGTRAAFERDRIRDTALQLAGYRVLRVTRQRLDSEPERVMAAIRSLL